ncbi:MAG TPA: cytochrome P450 [Nannocystaceae bacterium]|nr:cytochrome P450 [Nannocystaceae bacterium]
MGRIDDLPRVANTSWLGSFGRTTAERLAMQREVAQSSAPLVRGRVLHLPLVLPATPDACHRVLVTQAKSFEKSPGLRVLLHDLAGEGLFTSEGELWRRQRKLMAPIFTPVALAQYAEAMRVTAERSAAAMRPGQAIDLAHETTRIAMTVVGNALFGIDTFDEADELGAALTTGLGWVNGVLAAPAIIPHILVLDMTRKLAARTRGRVQRAVQRIGETFESPFLLPGSRSRELRDAMAVVDGRIHELIAERRRDRTPRSDLLSRLLNARDADVDGTMSDKQVRDEVITLFVAGHETTATSLAWCFYLLSRHPQVLERVVAEADAFGDGPITHFEPEKLALTTRVFKEALRLYPPLVMFPRRTIEAVELCGTQLPPRTLVFVSAYAQHRRADVWPDPDRFSPDRFLPELEALRPKGSYLPFSAGPRFCIGMHFAMMEGPIVLATLLRRHRFEIDPEREIVEDDFATLRPRGGVPAIVRAR